LNRMHEIGQLIRGDAYFESCFVCFRAFHRNFIFLNVCGIGVYGLSLGLWLLVVCVSVIVRVGAVVLFKVIFPFVLFGFLFLW